MVTIWPALVNAVVIRLIFSGFSGSMTYTSRAAVVSSVTLLLLWLGSGLFELTEAWLVMLPEVFASTVTSMVYWAEKPLAMPPRLQFDTPLGSLKHPVVLTKVTPAGKKSVTFAPAATEGPRFWTVMV